MELVITKLALQPDITNTISTTLMIVKANPRRANIPSLPPFAETWGGEKGARGPLR